MYIRNNTHLFKGKKEKRYLQNTYMTVVSICKFKKDFSIKSREQNITLDITQNANSGVIDTYTYTC